MTKKNGVNRLKFRMSFKFGVILMIVFTFGHLIPMDYKVCFGFVCGLITGAYMLPEVIAFRIANEIENVWKVED